MLNEMFSFFAAIFGGLGIAYLFTLFGIPGLWAFFPAVFWGAWCGRVKILV